MTTPLLRARSQIGKLRYVLGKGGRDPEARSPGDATAACDCSGFVCWALGFDRHQPGFAGYDWVSTDSLVSAARSGHPWFSEVPVPAPGDLVVYPGLYRGGKRVRIGHVGLVSVVPAEHPGPALYDWIRVIHCSAGNQRRTGAAVQETSGAAWKGKGSLFLRYRG